MCNVRCLVCLTTIWVHFDFRMALYDKLSSLQKLEGQPKVSLKDLTRSEGYRILSAKRVDTCFARPAIMLDVEINDKGGTGVIFLPSRFTDSLDDEDLDKLVETKDHRIQCTGVTGNSPDVLIWREVKTSHRKKSARYEM